MKKIHTDIEINAPAKKVWSILMNFEAYKNWNPFITTIKGDQKVGARFYVTLHPPDGKPMQIKPKCRTLYKDAQLSWKGHLLFPGIFDGEHFFEIKKITDDRCLFVHRENFGGILVPFVGAILKKTKAGFEAMNRELKTLAEK